MRIQKYVRTFLAVLFFASNVYALPPKEAPASPLEEPAAEYTSSERDLTYNNAIFNPVTTLSARTLKPGRLGFQRAAGSNIHSSALVSSLSVGVFPRFEIGTIPVYYLIPEHNMNVNAKLHFWKSENVDWAITFSHVRFDGDLPGGAVAKSYTNSRAFVVNLHPIGQRWSFGATIGDVCSYTDDDKLAIIYTFKCRTEGGIDLQVPVNKNQWVTVGISRLRDEGASAYEDVNTGAGFAWSKARPGKFISRPSLGIYFVPQTDDVLYLATTTFFEVF